MKVGLCVPCRQLREVEGATNRCKHCKTATEGVREANCETCGDDAQQIVEIEPDIYKAGKFVRRGIVATLCRECAQRIREQRGWQDREKKRLAAIAKANKARRDEAQLFDPGPNRNVA